VCGRSIDDRCKGNVMLAGCHHSPSLPSLPVCMCMLVIMCVFVCVCCAKGWRVEGKTWSIWHSANPSFALRRVASRSSPLPLSPLLAFDRPFSALLPQKSASKQSIINAHSDSNEKSMGGFASASW
jgi:hypothetical protein